MKNRKQIYTNKKWHEFSSKVKNRDENKCLMCGRTALEAILQVHHEIYVENKAPWEYALSDCRTLCKGCHAKEHGLVEPDRGWTLLSIDDLGGLDGVCERKNCGANFRYEHLTYHPNWGYKVVGSTCIEHLTQEDILLSSDIIKLYKSISEFVHNSEWIPRLTIKNKKYITCKKKHHLMRIYGEYNSYSYQIILKEKGVRQYDYRPIITAKNKGLEEVKELSYIVLKGTISEDEKEKSLLREIYKSIMQKTHDKLVKDRHSVADAQRGEQKNCAVFQATQS